jgi:membrane-associated HD superfamily phosphohydrolase
MKTFKQFAEALDTKLDYHDHLNPAIWDSFRLKDKVKDALDKIAKEFVEFLQIDGSAITDIILTGSNANYNWTKLSDVDLHIVADYDKICKSCEGLDFDDCMRAKKTLWNDQHDVTIYGFQVELYVQSSKERIVSNAGVFSLLNNDWIKKPSFEKVDLSNPAITAKAEAIKDEIDNAIDNKIDDVQSLKKIKEKIRTMRSAGLEKGGEYSIENLAFKALRNNGYLDKFSKYVNTIEDKSLSLE